MQQGSDNVIALSPCQVLNKFGDGKATPLSTAATKQIRGLLS